MAEDLGEAHLLALATAPLSPPYPPTLNCQSPPPQNKRFLACQKTSCLSPPPFCSLAMLLIMLNSFTPMLMAAQSQFKRHPFPEHFSLKPGLMLAINWSHLVFGFNCIGPEEVLLVCWFSFSKPPPTKKGGLFNGIEKFTPRSSNSRLL